MKLRKKGCWTGKIDFTVYMMLQRDNTDIEKSLVCLPLYSQIASDLNQNISSELIRFKEISRGEHGSQWNCVFLKSCICFVF